MEGQGGQPQMGVHAALTFLSAAPATDRWSAAWTLTHAFAAFTSLLCITVTCDIDVS